MTNVGYGNISVINTVTDTVTTTLSDSGNGPTGVGVTPDGAALFVANSSANSLSLWNTATNASLGTIALGSGANPQSIAMSPVFNVTSGGSLVGSEDDTNPVVAASSGVDTVDGVNTATGGYALNLNDLSLPDIGLGLGLSQTYDSRRSSVNGPFGYGWTFSYGMSLSVSAPSSGPTGCAITITQENGTPVVFSAATTTDCTQDYSSYTPPSWEQASLTFVMMCNDGHNCFDLKRGGGTQYLFDQTTGQLVSEKDPNGNTVTLSYSSGKLASVTGQSGQRSLSFAWTGSDITGVTDSAGRTATLGYSSGYLTDLTLSATSTGDPTSHHWHFSYNASNQLADWWNPDNEATYPGNTSEATQITYNSAGQVDSGHRPGLGDQLHGGHLGLRLRADHDLQLFGLRHDDRHGQRPGLGPESELRPLRQRLRGRRRRHARQLRRRGPRPAGEGIRLRVVEHLAVHE